ncbi:thioesterase domain-containing protein [Candidatus Merdisoma sp. JLR.KK006]|jgi:surfactin synthase thioesterase subunit|uniref:thioesterase II family protein n=1 Tax=Candidatus Merdisoma sp. JLR.KK006 TaxID=3112626 RepID=UPI002FF0D80D
MENVYKLICVPFAGGSSKSYLKWRSVIDPRIELIFYEMAGRGTRQNEKNMHTMEELIHDLVYFIENTADNEHRISIFGHSMGAYVFYEAYESLSKDVKTKIDYIFLSGAVSLKYIIASPVWNQILLPKDEFLNVVEMHGWVQKEILRRDSVRDYIYRVMKHDFSLMNNYIWTMKKINMYSQVYILYGQEDIYQVEQYYSWKENIEAPLYYWGFKGNHFFILDQYQEVVETINRILL